MNISDWLKVKIRQFAMRNVQKRVSIVGAGKISASCYWESAPEIWAVKSALWGLKEKGYKVDKAFYLDDINTYLLFKPDAEYMIPLLTEKWPYPDTELWMVNKPEWIENEKDLYSHWRLFDLVRFANVVGSDYINNSTALALAKALVDGYTHVDLHCVDFDYGEPHIYDSVKVKGLVRHGQCVAYWIGRMEQMGVKVRINPMSPLLDTVQKSKTGTRMRGLALSRFKELSTLDKEAYDRWVEMGNAEDIVTSKKPKILEEANRLLFAKLLFSGKEIVQQLLQKERTISHTFKHNPNAPFGALPEDLVMGQSGHGLPMSFPKHQGVTIADLGKIEQPRQGANHEI